MKLKVDLSSQSIEHLDQHEERGKGGKEKERREMEEVSGAEINWAEVRVFLSERSESFCTVHPSNYTRLTSVEDLAYLMCHHLDYKALFIHIECTLQSLLLSMSDSIITLLMITLHHFVTHFDICTMNNFLFWLQNYAS